MVTLDARAKRGRRGAASQATLATILAAALATAIFIFDVSLPLGVAGGVPDVALVLLGLWSPWRPAVFVLASVATALTVIGYGLSPVGGVAWMALANRALAVFIIWVAAVLIFERRKSDDALKEAQDELERRVDSRTAELRDANETLAHEDRTSEFSAEMATIFGVEQERLKLTDDQYIETFVHPDDRERVARVYALPGDMPRRYEIEYRIVRKDGAIRTIHEAGESAFDETGRIIGMSGTTQDITERKRVEEALRRSERHLVESQRIARVGSWDWDTRTDEVHWSDEAYRIFGVTRDELGGNLEGFYALVHPEDRARIACVDRDARDHKKSYSIDYRIVRPDGGVFNIFEIGEPECDETGRIVPAASLR